MSRNFCRYFVSRQRYPESIDAYQRLYNADSSKVDYLFNIANSYIKWMKWLMQKKLLQSIFY